MVKRKFQTRKSQPSRFIFSKIGPWCTNTNTKNWEILKNAGGSCKENSYQLDINIFGRQEMRKVILELKKQLNEWCDCLGKHVPKILKHKGRWSLYENNQKALKGEVENEARQTKLQQNDKIRVHSMTVVKG